MMKPTCKNLWLVFLSLSMGLAFSACDDDDEETDDDIQSVTISGDVADAVDMGTSVKWAKWNLGASRPEQYGVYFAWAESAPKTSYNWESYKWGNMDALTKYSNCSDFGVVDNKMTLEKRDDAASVNWGGKWRTPSADEWKELKEKCSWTWTTDYEGTGICGYAVTNTASGNSIFLPAAGFMSDEQLVNAADHGYYWSSSLYQTSSIGACDTDFSDNWVGANNYHFRILGSSIRPVMP